HGCAFCAALPGHFKRLRTADVQGAHSGDRWAPLQTSSKCELPVKKKSIQAAELGVAIEGSISLRGGARGCDADSEKIVSSPVAPLAESCTGVGIENAPVFSL